MFINISIEGSNIFNGDTHSSLYLSMLGTLVFLVEVPLYHAIDTRIWMYVFGGRRIALCL